MMSYSYSNIVNKSEVNALKEMIFQRVKERSQNMNDDAHDDIMDMARDSFVSKNNPFSQIINSAQKAVETQPKQEDPRDSEIGFPIKELKPRAAEQTRVVQEQMTASSIQNNMMEAREALNNKKSFMGALNFLNSQAAVSLMRTRADVFEVVV